MNSLVKSYENHMKIIRKSNTSRIIIVNTDTKIHGKSFQNHNKVVGPSEVHHNKIILKSL